MSRSGPDEIRVACAFEGDTYVRHCAAMLHSLLTQAEHAGVQIDCLHGDDSSPRSRERLADMVRSLGGSIAFHPVPERWLDGLPLRGFTGKATWYRLFLDELLSDAERVLYLDCDLIVLDSLQALWRTELGGCILGAVTNVAMRADFDRPTWLGLPRNDSYFNAGVLIVDLGRMRREETGPELRAFAQRRARELGWRDQDVLNLVLHDRRLPLAPRWNAMNSLMSFPWADEYFGEEELQAARLHPAIRHFEGPSINKPWHLLCDPEHRRLYTEHRRHTPWPRVLPSGCTPGNLVRYVRARRGWAHAA